MRRPDAVVGVLAVVSPSVIAGIAPGRMAGLGLSDPVAAVRDGVRRLRAAGAARVVVLTDGPRDTRALDEIDALQRHLSEPGAPDLLLAAGLADEETGRTVRLLRREGAPPVVGSAAGARALTVIRIAGAEVTADAVQTAAGRARSRDRAADRHCGRHHLRPRRPADRSRAGQRDAHARGLSELRPRGDAPPRRRRDRAHQCPVRQTGAVPDHRNADPRRSRARSPLPRGHRSCARAGAGGRVAARPRARQRQAGRRRPRQGPPAGLQVNGRPLDKAREYRVATIAFVAEGGDGIFAPHALPFAPLARRPRPARCGGGVFRPRHRRRGRRSDGERQDRLRPPARRPPAVGGAGRRRIRLLRHVNLQRPSLRRSAADARAADVAQGRGNAGHPAAPPDPRSRRPLRSAVRLVAQQAARHARGVGRDRRPHHRHRQLQLQRAARLAAPPEAVHSRSLRAGLAGVRVHATAR